MKKIWLIFFVVAFTLANYHFERVRNLKNLTSMQNDIVILQARYIEILIERLKTKHVHEVTLTAYTPTEEECDKDPLIAASMRKVRLGTVAVSRDLFDQGWVFGRKVRIEGHGIFEINDLMNKRFRARIDVFMWDKVKAKKFGKKRVKVALLEF